MNRFIRQGFRGLLWFWATALPAADSLIWQTNQDRVTADLQSVEVVQVYARVTQLTGWQIFLESNVTTKVSVKFSDLPSGEALRFLLRDLNYALVPQTNENPRLFVFRTERTQATLMVHPGDLHPEKKLAARKIPNELVVRLRPGISIEDLAKQLGAKVLGKIEGLSAYRLQFTDEAAAGAALSQLSGNAQVASVESNYTLDPPAPVTKLQGGTSGLPAPLQLALNPPGNNGRVTVGLIDTAVQPQGNNLDQFLVKSISIAGPANLDPSVPSHGTSMFQDVLQGVASTAGGSSAVQVISVDVYGSYPTANSFNVAAGIATAINNGANVINLSLGSQNNSSILNDIISQATQKGIPVFAAAGNDASAQAFYPAADPALFRSPPATAGNLLRTPISGSYVKLMAPGSAVIYFDNQPYLVTGTSTASAITSGLAAGVADSKQLSTASAANSLLNTSSLQFAPKKSRRWAGSMGGKN